MGPTFVAQILHERVLLLVWTEGAGSSRRRRQAADYFECPKPNGLFADPKTCRRFINCVETYPYLSHCPGGLHFDDISKSCMFQKDATCGPVSTSQFRLCDAFLFSSTR